MIMEYVMRKKMVVLVRYIVGLVMIMLNDAIAKRMG
jgi:hypothetical protein